MPETRCPTCGGPVIEDSEVLTRMFYHPETGISLPLALRVYRTTAPDPATVAAMRELLGEIRAELIGDNRHWMLWERDRKLNWSGKIAALLGPA